MATQKEIFDHVKETQRQASSGNAAAPIVEVDDNKSKKEKSDEK